MFGSSPPPPPPTYAPRPAVNPFTPPPGYTPPLPPGTEAATPESKTGLYIGLGVGAIVLIGGAYLIFSRH